MKPSANLHLIVQALIKNPPIANDCDRISDFMREMVEHVRMKVLFEPVTRWCTDEGNEGITSVIGITTSASWIHIWNNPVPELSRVEFDLYSCSPFTPREVIEKLRTEFDVVKISYKFLDRDNDLKELESGKE